MTASEPGDLARLRADRVALALLLVAALVRALFLAEVISQGIDLRGRYNIDAYLYDHWARRVVAGDVAMRQRYDYSGIAPDEPGAPRSNVAIEVLGVGRYDATYPAVQYYDYPGYPYFVAAFYSVFGVGSNAVLVAQELMDVFSCALVYLIALRAFDRTTARVALSLAALSGPLIFYAGFLLRDSLVAALLTVLVYVTQRVRTTRSWAILGFLFGVVWLVKGTAVLLLPFMAAKLPLRREVVRHLAGFAFGSALALCPFVARNVALGAPPLGFTTIQSASLVLYNVRDGGTRGLYLNMPEARRVAANIPEVSDRAALVAAIRSHPSFASWLSQGLERAKNLFVADDAWDNVRYSYLAPRLRSLWMAPVRWKLIMPFAVLGAALIVLRHRSATIVLAPIVLVVGLSVVSVCTTRYRLPAEPAAAVAAAVGLVWLLREARRKRAHAIYGVLACLALSIALHDPVPPPSPERVTGYVLGTFPQAAKYLLR